MFDDGGMRLHHLFQAVAPAPTRDQVRPRYRRPMRSRTPIPLRSGRGRGDPAQMPGQEPVVDPEPADGAVIARVGVQRLLLRSEHRSTMSPERNAKNAQVVAFREGRVEALPAT